MSKYINNTLTSGEKVIYESKLSIWSLLPLILLGLVTLIWGVGLIFLIVAYLKYISTELAFTNKRVIAKFGFISRRTIEINTPKVESLQVNQGILGRIFNFGTIIVSGAGNPQAPIPGISNPLGFRRAFMEHQDQTSSENK